MNKLSSHFWRSLSAGMITAVLIGAPLRAVSADDSPAAAKYPAPLELPATPELAPAPPPAPSPGWAPIPVAPSASTATGSSTPPRDTPSEDIRDIRGPKDILPFWVIPALLAGVVILALAAYLIWRWQRRQRPVRPLLPFEIALQRLEAIRALMQPSSVREFSIAITDVVREYIEQRFRITASHRTTEEFLHDLLQPSQGSLAVHRALLAEFLHHCDLAKFAGMALTRENMESLHASARTFVQETAKPDVTPEETRAALPAT